MARNDLTAADVRLAFHYDPLTGDLWRLHKTHSRRVTNRNVAGYVQVKLGGRVYYAHRVILLWVHGEWPKHEVDHINMVKGDNRLVNLRAATKEINMQNVRRVRSHNTSGFLGVTFNRAAPHRPWKAQLRVNGRNVNVGSYPTPEAAHEAYLEAKRRLHEGCTI